MKTPFVTDFMEGSESVMRVSGFDVSQVRFDHRLKEISIVYKTQPKYNEGVLSGLHWRKLKDIIEKEGGKWENKAEGIKYLLSLTF